ncbi:MAG: AzlC family ABC transporter permease [Anaerolineales bacterium]
MNAPPALPNRPVVALWHGVRADLPLALGGIAFGMIYGVLAREAGIPATAAQAMSSILFAGSAQFVTTQLVMIGTPAVVMVLTIFVVNLRHMLYSASLAPYLQDFKLRWKLILSYLLTDETYAVAITHFNRAPHSPTRNWFFLGAGLTEWISWQLSTAAGIFLGALIPSSWSLDFTLALMFIALVIPAIKDYPTAAAALAAGVTAVAAYQLPYQLGLLAAALVGILVGAGLERLK